MESQIITIDGRNCIWRQKGTQGPIIYWGLSSFGDGDPLDKCRQEFDIFFELLETELTDRKFTLLAFIVDDWNRELSPWPSGGFAGGGKETLDWLVNSAIPTFEDHLRLQEGQTPEKRSQEGQTPECPQTPKCQGRYLIGYSLAGLFALWAAYESDVWTGVASCSGSLWYENWDEYADSHAIRSAEKVYLSLGGKEEKTKDPVMATVGIRTREEEKRLKKEAVVKRSILEWNSGGHFADSNKRLRKAVCWLLAGSV